MSLLDELRRDHEHLNSSLEEVERSGAGANRLLAVAAEIEEHDRLEEELLLEELGPELALEGGFVETLRREHAEIALRIDRIRRSNGDPGEIARHRARLIELLAAHFAKEEQVLFPFVERLLDADWLAGRGAAFRQTRRRHPLRVGPEVRVADLAREAPATIRVFQRHGIDFCCGGKRGLEEACAARGASYENVARDLTAALDAGDADAGERWTGRPAVEIVGHVLARYHAGLRDELARLEAMALRAHERHGATNPELGEIHAVVTELRSRMVEHLDREERVLFPAVLRGDADALAAEFAVAEDEHSVVGDLLARLRAVSRNFRPPEGACNTWRGLFHGLEELERDTHVHVHLENNLLFPQVLAHATSNA
jgi:regulator of cell morphogenesis and NO signaling